RLSTPRRRARNRPSEQQRNRGRTRTRARMDADKRARTAWIRISRMERILRICSVRARDSTRHEPGRSLFFNDVGKLLAPDPDWCAVPKSYRPGSLRAEGVVEEEQSVKSV